MWAAITDHYVGANYAATMLATAPLVWYRFADTSGGGSTPADSSGNARHGNYQGGGHTFNVAGLTSDGNGAVLLNGTTAYATTPNASWYHTASATVQVFVKPTSTPAAIQILAANDIGNFTGSNLRRWQIRMTAAAKFEYVFWVADGGAVQSIVGTVSITGGNTYRAWGSYNSGTGVAQLWVSVNGAAPTLDATATIAGALPVLAGGNSNPIHFGRSSSTSANFYGGVMDEGAVWGSALSSTTIANIAAAAVV